jgi:hypothetical protein
VQAAFRAPELAGDSREQGALQMDAVSQSSRLVYAALKDMTEGGNADLAKSFQNLASELESAGFDVSIEYHIGDGKTYRTFFVRSGNGTSEIRTESAPETQLRVFMAEETGTRSPRQSPGGAHGNLIEYQPTHYCADNRCRSLNDGHH